MPLVSGLPACRRSHFVEAFKEVLVNFVLATSPIWLGSLITFSVVNKQPKTLASYFSTLTTSLSGGEMLIYATAAIAPMFYFALTRTGRARDFPSRLSHIVCALLIFMICTALFGVQRSGVELDPDFIFPTSLVIFAFAMVMIFIATAYRNWRDTAGEVIDIAETLPQIQETAFVQSAREHRNG